MALFPEMETIRAEPLEEAVEGAWRIRTAVPALSASYTYDGLTDLHPPFIGFRPGSAQRGGRS